MLRNADGGGGCVTFSGEKRYEGVGYNIITVTREWVQFPGKQHYVTLECPHIRKEWQYESDQRCFLRNQAQTSTVQFHIL